MCCFILLSLPHTHADHGSVCSIVLISAAQDVMKLGKSIEFIMFIPSGGVACV